MRMLGRTVGHCVWLSCVCANVCFFLFNTLLKSKSGSCSAILGSNDVYLHSGKFPPFCWMPSAVVNGCHFLFFFFPFHSSLSCCFHLPFGWASLLWCTNSRFSGPPAFKHSWFVWFFHFLIDILLQEWLPAELFYTIYFYFPSPKSLSFIMADVLCLLLPMTWPWWS